MKKSHYTVSSDFYCPVNSFWAIYEMTRNRKLSLLSLYQFGIPFTVVCVFVIIFLVFAGYTIKVAREMNDVRHLLQPLLAAVEFG